MTAGIRGPAARLVSEGSLGSPSNPFASTAELPSPSSLPVGQYWCAKLAGPGLMKMQNIGGLWRPEMNSFSPIELVDPFSVVSPGGTTPVSAVIASVPAGFIQDGDKYRFAFTFFEDGANTGADLCEILLGAVGLATSSGLVSAGQNFWVDAVYQRSGYGWRRNSLAWSTANSSNPSAPSGNPGSSFDIIARITPASGANKTYLRSFSLTRTY